MILFGTLGPACNDEAALDAMLEAGMGGLRVNLSHMGLDQCASALDMARRAAEKRGRSLLLLADLQGPELRVGREGLPMPLEDGAVLPLGKLPLPETVLPYLTPGQALLLDDGRLALTALAGGLFRVERGGTLLPGKSLALPGVSLSLPPLTRSDEANLALAPQLGIGGVMQPFVRGREDLLAVRRALDARGGRHIQIFAKVENRQGLVSLPEWLDLADWVVVARGDLGNSVPLAALPAAQKEIAGLCGEKGKPFLIATQLLHSMEQNPVPTRAEVSDIFNGVLDGASGLMLTGETAAGKYPARAMGVLRETAGEARAFLNRRKENSQLWITSK